MINEIQQFIDLLAKGQHLSVEQAGRAFQIIMLGGATPAQMAALLIALRTRGETVDEITGAARAMRAKMQTLSAPPGTMDTCGTGGDAKGTLNISTAVALVVAASGVPIAKHGNRSVSSNSGSADVLTALGVNINAGIPLLEKSLRECNICFMMATRFHPAMRHVAPVRQELGIRTIFNLLGPLSNPASPKYQLLGVYSKEWTAPLAQVLKNLGSESAWVVHGSDGLDELTLTGPSFVTELKHGEMKEFEILPEEYGFEIISLDKIKGQNPEYNARSILQILAGAQNPYRNVVLLNAGAALVASGKARDLKDGIAIAADAIDSGKAKQTLGMLVSISNEEVLVNE